MVLTAPGSTEALSAERLEDLYAPPPGPWCRANFVVTVDGAIEVDGRSGGLGDADDRSVFATLRALADVVLVGSGTARSEDYGPSKPSSQVQARRQGRAQAARPPIAVLTGSARIDPAARLFVEAAGDDGAPRPIVLTSGGADPGRRAALAEVAEVVTCGDGDGDVDLTAALAALRDRGLASVLFEGGPTVLTRLLAGGLVDELCLTHAPAVAGPGHAPLLGGDPLERPLGLERTRLLTGDAALFATYRVRGRR